MMLSFSIIISLFAATVLATPHPAPQPLVERATPSCNRDNLFRCFTASSALAGPYCTSILPVVTVTASTTISPSVTSTSTVSVTITNSVSATTTTTSTTLTTTTGTTTQTITSTEISLTTTTATSVTAAPLRKRAIASPQCLTKDGSKSTSYPASRITSACSCLYDPSTTTVTPTAATSTIVATTTTNPVVTVTVTSTSTIPATSTSTTITTALTTTTTTTASTSTALVTSTVSFTQVHIKRGYPSCAYNRYYAAIPNVSGDPANDFATGRNQCKDACAADTRCKFFYYDAYDPEHARGYDGGECDLDDQPYDPSLLQCNLPTRYGIGFNKNP